MRQDARRDRDCAGLHLDGYNELPMGARALLRHWRVIRLSASWPFPALALDSPGNRRTRRNSTAVPVIAQPEDYTSDAALRTACRSRERVEVVDALTEELIDLLEEGRINLCWRE